MSTSSELSATLVVSIGGAGKRILRTVHDRANEENLLDNYEFLVVDSTEQDHVGDQFDINEKLIFRDDLDDDDFDRHRSRDTYRYLPEWAELPDEGGATRQRPVGRYYLDRPKHFTEAKEKIKKALERAATGADFVNVFIVHSLGGGTGSGMFPSFAALTRLVADSENHDYRLRGIGSLPRLQSGGIIDIADPRFHVNSYAALRELRTVLGRSNQDGEVPLHFEHGPRGQDIKQDFLEVNVGEGEKLFDEYFLIGYDEQEPGENYRRRMNEMAADLIIYYGLVDGPEQFPSGGFSGSGVAQDVYSLDAAKIDIPVEELFDYFQTDTRIDNLKREREDIAEQAAKFEADHKYLNSVLQLERGVVPEEDDDSPAETQTETVPPRFVQKCNEQAQSVGEVDDKKALKRAAETAAQDIVDETVHGRQLQEAGRFQRTDDVDDETIDAPHPSDEEPPLSERLDEFDVSDVVEFLFYDHRETHVRNKRKQADQEWGATLDDIWSKYEDNGELQDTIPELYEDHKDNTDEKRTTVLYNFFEDRLSELRDKKEGFFSGWRGPDPEELIKERKEDRDELLEKFNEYKKWNNHYTWTADKRGEKRAELEARRNDFDTASEYLRQKEQNLEEDEERLEGKRSRLRASLQERELSTHMSVPIENLDALDVENFAEWVEFERDDEGRWSVDEIDQLREVVLASSKPMVSMFVNENYILEEDIKQVIENVLSQMEEPTENRNDSEVATDLLEKSGVGQTNPVGLLALLIHNENTKEPDLSKFIEDQATTGAYFNETAEDTVSVHDGSTIRLLGIYGNLQFPKMSEYGELHEHYRADEKEISEALFGAEKPQVDRHLVWAYPELVDESESSIDETDVDIPTE